MTITITDTLSEDLDTFLRSEPVRNTQATLVTMVTLVTLVNLIPMVTLVTTVTMVSMLPFYLGNSQSHRHSDVNVFILKDQVLPNGPELFHCTYISKLVLQNNMKMRSVFNDTS